MAKRDIGIISGHFTVCLHKGHIEYIQESRKRCDKLYCIVNNAKQVEKKGLPELFDFDVIAHLLRGIGATYPILSVDEDESVARTVEKIYLDEKRCISDYHSNDWVQATFFNGGDRGVGAWNQKEVDICKKYNIAMVYLPLPKIDSSSERIRKAVEWYEENTKEYTNGRIKVLEDAIRKHRDFRGDDRCHHDDTELYQVLPEGYTPPEMDTAVELENCKKFIQCRQNPATQYVSPQRRIEELECMVKKYEKILGFANVIKAVREHCGECPPKPESNLKSWPKDWPRYKQGCFVSWDSACDMLVGPCACGASHSEGEFEYKDGVLFRYGEKVSQRPPKPEPPQVELVREDQDKPKKG